MKSPASIQQLCLLLDANGLHPNKALSQNFLIDRNIVQKILRAIPDIENTRIVEIGPGAGSLTYDLLLKKAQVIAIEADKGLARALHRLSSLGDLTIYHEDILKFPLAETLERLPSSKKTHVISNLPYHITSPILAALLPQEKHIATITCMMQKEVAMRCVAKERTAHYGSLSLLTHYYATPQFLFSIPETVFYPRPSVLSAVVQFTLRPCLPFEDSPFFFGLTRLAFQKRRKMLRSLLKPFDLTPILQSQGIRPTSRPEDLSLQEFIALASALKKAKISFPIIGSMPA